MPLSSDNIEWDVFGNGMLNEERCRLFKHFKPLSFTVKSEITSRIKLFSYSEDQNCQRYYTYHTSCHRYVIKIEKL